MSVIRGFDKGSLNITLRVHVALGVVCAAFFLLFIRLWYLQILNGAYFRNRSENNLLRTVFVPPPRGYILDRHGVVLAKNRPSFDIELVSEDAPKPKETVGHLADVLGIDRQQLLDKLLVQKKRRRFEPKLLLKDVNRDVLAKVSARRDELPGITINVRPARDYVNGDGAAHVLGYIREITRDQLDSPTFSGYMMGDVVGQFGIEYQWERFLRGDRGVQAVIVNAGGVKIGEKSFKPEMIGHNLTLTIDQRAQKAADDALATLRGAVVAMDPNTGEVLALSSSPRFNPNVFTEDIPADMWKDLVSGPERKLSNRAVQGGFPPGSTFKIFMAAAGLAEEVVKPNEFISCGGSYFFGGRSFRCHKKSGHGAVDMRAALIQSCDVYFYTVGQRLGIDRIHDYSTRFGLGMLTGLTLAEENPGIIPSTEWKRRYFKRPEDKKWYPGETISVAIGQGAVVITPLQLTRGVSALVNGGRVLKPYLVKKISSTNGSFVDENFTPQEVGSVDISPKIIEQVREALVGVVNDPRGTGHKAQLDKAFDILVGGKTGTAQSAGAEHFSKGGRWEDHAWFVGYAPVDKPEIVVTALIEHGGHGGAAAAPVVRQVMEAFFADRKKVVDIASNSKQTVAPASPAEPEEASVD